MSDLAIPEVEDENILKPRVRKSPAFTPEQRAAMSERMKKVNADRIAKARSKPENSKAEETRKKAEDAKLSKQAELEAEIERLKQEAAAAPKLAKTPKPRKPRVPKEEKEVAELDALVKKAKERQVVPDETDIESEEDVPPPPKITRARKSIAVPKTVAKFL
jgi:hypothetical protein